MLHRIPGLIFVILGLASLADAWRITSTVRDTATFDALGPDRYLMLASVLMVISGALLALIPAEPQANTATPPTATAGAGRLPPHVLILLALIGFALATPYAGFEAACLGFFLYAFSGISGWPLLRSLLAAVIAVAILYVVFVWVADVPLPKGTWRS